jgi:hypothetical protein
LRVIRWRPQPRSLRRQAIRLKDGIDQTTRTQRLLRRGRILVAAIVLDARNALIAVFAAAFLPALLPIDASLHLGNAVGFLQVLWQVEAATVALTITIVLFVFQVFSSRSSSSVHEFAEETGFFPIFYAGLSAIAVTGAVLLGYGHGNAAGWAGVWATAWSGVGLALVAVLFVTALQAIDAANLRNRRVQRARQQVDEVVENVILERVAFHLLDAECKRAGVEFGWLGDSQDARKRYEVRRAGRVHDINLKTLRRAGEEAQEARLLQPRLSVKIGDRVRVGSEWLSAQPVLLTRIPALGRALKVRDGRDTDERLRQTLEELHEEALAAIAAPAPARYRQIVDAYTDIVTRLPEAWRRFGQNLEQDVGVSSDIFGWTFLDTLRNNAYEEVLHALAATDRDVAQEILNFPIDVAQRAIPARAFALARTALQLLTAYHHALLRSTHPHRTMLRTWLHARLREYADFHIEPTLTRDGSTLEEKKDAEQGMRDAFNTFAEFLKTSLEFDPRDTETVSELNREWDQLLQHWQPEYRRPDKWLVDAIERERGPADAEVRRLRAEAATNAELAAIKDRLVRLRRLHRFGLCFWALHRYRATHEQAWLDAFNNFGGYVSSPADQATALADAIQHEWDNHGPWSGWLLGELPSGEVHGVSPEPGFVEAFVLLALPRIDPDGAPPQLPAIRQLAIHLQGDRPREVVASALGDDNLRDLLPERADDRAAKLQEAIEALIALVKQQDEDATIATPLDQEAVDRLLAETREEWRKHGLFRAAFAQQARIAHNDGEAPEPNRIRVSGWQSKGAFLSGEHHVYGGEHLAEELARALEREQTARVLELGGMQGDAQPPAENPSEQVRTVVGEMRAAGRAPQLICIPDVWDLLAQLDVEPAAGWGGNIDPPAWFPEHARRDFRGRLDGVAVVTLREVRDDRAAICDLGSLGIWHEWPERNDPRVTIETFDEAQARALAEGAEGDEDVDALARRIQLRVKTSAELAFEIVVENPDAIRWITLPPVPDEAAV